MDKSTTQLTGLKKRQQIIAANKMIFVWITIASIVVSLSVVVGQFLVRQMLFNQKIISAKSQTVSVLDKNLKVAPELETAVKSLTADPALSKARANSNDNSLRVVFDALPVTEDQSALAASLQNIVLAKSNVAVSNLTLSQASSMSTGGTTATSSSASPIPSGAQKTVFSFAVDGSYDDIKQMLLDMERTIRPLNVTSMTVDKSAKGLLHAEIAGDTYYTPSMTVQLSKKTIKP